MKRLPFTIICALSLNLCTLCSCSGNKEELTENQRMAGHHGTADANAAVQAQEGSMQRERAILHIRATEQALLQASDTAAARTYIDSARVVLLGAGVISE